MSPCKTDELLILSIRATEQDMAPAVQGVETEHEGGAMTCPFSNYASTRDTSQL